MDEDWQARQVAAVVGAALAGGAQRVLWHTLADPPAVPKDHRGFHTNSLFRSVPDGDNVSYEPKPAALMFRALAHRLAGVSPADVSAVEARGGRVLATPKGWLVYEGEPVDVDGPWIDLLTGDPAATPTAPVWIDR